MQYIKLKRIYFTSFDHSMILIIVQNFGKIQRKDLNDLDPGLAYLVNRFPHKKKLERGR